MIPALKNSPSTTLSLTCSTTENEREARVEICVKSVLEIAKAVGKEDKIHLWIPLCVKLFADSRQEMVAANVHAFVRALAKDSEGTFYRLCAESGTEKWCQEGFQALWQLSSGRGFRDMQKVAAVLHKDPFLLVACLVPGFIKGVIPSEKLDEQEVDMFTEALEHLRPSWDRFAAQAVHDQSFDPLVQTAVQSILSTMSKTSFLRESLAPFIHFFSTVVFCKKIPDELKQTLTGQKMNSLAAEVETARKFCKKFGSSSTQEAKELKKDGKLSQIQEFLLLDLPVLVSVLDKINTLASFSDFKICGVEVGNTLVKTGAKAAFKIGAFLGDAHSIFTGVSASDQMASKLEEDDPHSPFIQFLIRFLNSLGVDEKEQMRSAVEKEMMPFLLTLGTELLKKHELKLYLPRLIELKEITMRPEETKKQNKEVVTIFASIFLHLLEEIECHYPPAFESLCEAFWQIGEQDPDVQRVGRPDFNFPVLKEKAVLKVAESMEVVDAENAETQIKQNVHKMEQHLVNLMSYSEYFKNPNLGRVKIFRAAQAMMITVADKELNIALMRFLDLWRGERLTVWPFSYLETRLISFSVELFEEEFNCVKNILKKSIDNALLEYRSYETQHEKGFLEEYRLNSVLMGFVEQREKTLQALESKIADITRNQFVYLEKAHEEFMASFLIRESDSVKIATLGEGQELTVNFAKITKEEGPGLIGYLLGSNTKKREPDLERQTLMLQRLRTLMDLQKISPTSIRLIFCAVLTAENLKPFLHSKLTHLDLRGSSISYIPKEIETLSPNLEELHLHGCDNLEYISNWRFSGLDPIILPHLKVLNVDGCSHLRRVQINSSCTVDLKVDGTGELETIKIPSAIPNITSSPLYKRLEEWRRDKEAKRKNVSDAYPLFFVP